MPPIEIFGGPPNPGAKRAALLLRLLGDESAALVRARMDGRALAQLQGVQVAQDDPEGAATLQGFANDFSLPTPAPTEIQERSAGASSAPPPEASRVRAPSEAPRARRSSTPVPPKLHGPKSVIESAPPWRVAELLVCEHPQVLAAVLATLDRKAAGRIVRALPPEIARASVVRLARLQAVSVSVLEEVFAALAEELALPPDKGQNNWQAAQRNIDGAAVAASLLSSAEGLDCEQVVDALQTKDARVAARLAPLLKKRR